MVGATGSGKTYLSRLASERFDLPVHELDALRRDSAGREIAPDRFAEAVAALAAGEDWIIDGHYRDVRNLIWTRADTVLWLNYPLSVIVTHLLGRFRRKRRPAADSSSRPAASGGGPKASWRRRLGRFSRTLRERREYGRVLRQPEFAHVEIVELRSPEAADEWLRRHAE